jgi:hypothetical protein
MFWDSFEAGDPYGTVEACSVSKDLGSFP